MIFRRNIIRTILVREFHIVALMQCEPTTIAAITTGNQLLAPSDRSESLQGADS